MLNSEEIKPVASSIVELQYVLLEASVNHLAENLIETCWKSLGSV